MSKKKQVGELSQSTIIFVRIALFWFFGVLIILPIAQGYQNYVITLIASLATIAVISLELLKIYHIRKQLLEYSSTRIGIWWAKRQGKTGYEIENTKKAISKPLGALSVIAVFLLFAPLFNVINPILNTIGLILVMVNLALSLIQMESYSTD